MNILMEYWTLVGLSRLASVLGNPLHMDAATESKQKINFARLCVEMPAASKFPIIIRAKRNNVTFVDVKVGYCWKPVVCEHCKVFDHSTQLCLVATKLVRSLASVKGNAPAAEWAPPWSVVRWTSRKGEWKSPPQTTFINRNPMVTINNLEGNLGKNSVPIAAKSSSESDAGDTKKKKNGKTPLLSK
ncbi:hypothetical protein CFOL_v3_29861 [Cephalotus follicularis]|uniref:Uncharacterized protein n=1 Tax=Cephalotus follicularis TaxID=3775 RepID=A0A1Q3D1R9_CEPFO|nr:hypothetical protein CFOL_v3_29861 [Cephalotus follicularis]